MEYACHSPATKRWFVMRVMPLKGLARDRPGVAHGHHRRVAEP